MIPSPGTRATLFDRLQDSKDLEARALFCEIYYPLIRSYLRFLARQPADLEDLTHDVLLLVFKKIGDFRYDPAKKFRAWLRTVAYHAFCSWRRKHPLGSGTGDSDVQALLQQVPAREEDEVYWDKEYDLQLLRWAADKVKAELEEPIYQAFRLVVLEGRTLAEAAAVMGQNIAWVFRRKEKVLERIRARLQGIAEEPDKSGR